MQEELSTQILATVTQLRDEVERGNKSQRLPNKKVKMSLFQN